jgi:hypothetical protein
MSTMELAQTGTMDTAPSTRRAPGRIRAALRKVGWWIVDGMATDNGWYWTLSGTWVPSAAYAARIVAEPAPRDRLEARGMRLPPA